jgi:hypothetical protein
MGSGGSFFRGKVRPGSEADHSLHLVPWSQMSRDYTTSPPCRVNDGRFTLLYIINCNYNVKLKGEVIYFSVCHYNCFEDGVISLDLVFFRLRRFSVIPADYDIDELDHY